ncbi:MAG: hypothetical protein H0T97_03245 [Actinobacteria bacterium]|nr:hypothetical protein [Actinomycetota bacterium]
MKDEGDPFETLRRINPVDPSTLPDPVRSREALDSMERILQGAFPSPERRRFRLRAPWQARRRRVYLVPVVAAAVLAAATLAWAFTRGPTQHLSVGCYAAIDPNGRAAVVPATEASPVETCEKLWLDGAFGKPPPPLEACLLPSGAVGVFPSAEGDSCKRLNLAPVPAGGQPPSALVELQNTLADAFLKRCLSESAARRIVQDEFRRLNLQEWRVVTSGRFTPARPCASLAFAEEQSEVTLVPIPR